MEMKPQTKHYNNSNYDDINTNQKQDSKLKVEKELKS